MLMVCIKRLFQPQQQHQLAADTRILAGDKIHLGQHTAGAEGNILHIPDRSRDDIQYAHAFLSALR